MSQRRRSPSPFFLCVFGFLRLLSLAAARPTRPSHTQARTGNTQNDLDNNTPTLAFDAIKTILGLGTHATSGVVNGLDVPQTADFVAAMAEYDRHMDSTTFMNNATQLFQNFQRLNPTFTTYVAAYCYGLAVNSDTARWGLAAYHIYNTYNNRDFLGAAENIWNQLQPSFVNASDAALGHLTSSPGNGAFSPTCAPAGNSSQAVPVQGAVFFTHTNPTVNGETIGPFIVLSSHLYRETQNDTYRSAAEQSIDFFTTFLISGANVFDAYNVDNCSLVDDRLFTYNAGFFIEGVSVYANVTGNYTSLTSSDNLHALVSTQVTAGFGNWTCPGGNSPEPDIEHSQCPSGVFNVDTNDLTTDWKAIFVHGLYEYVTRSSANTPVTNLVEEFINRQFQAVLKRAVARLQNVRAYGSNWNGPQPSILTLPGQLAAAGLFNVVLALQGPITAVSPTGSSATTPPSSSTKTVPSDSSFASRTHVGAIVGGVIGSITSLALLAALLLFFRRRTRRHAYYQPRPIPEPRHRENAIDPFPSSSSPPPEPTSRRVRTADGTRITKVQRERYAPSAASVFPVVPAYSIAPGPEHAAAHTNASARTINVDTETLQRVSTSFQSLMARMQRREDIRRHGRGACREESQTVMQEWTAPRYLEHDHKEPL
ncbi:hypothetical protein K488DRAFT_90571 [Vararia minispora EC-137]|uniref:Uncharacterized protein n=1 Tax=Vararia minispora EC-137 TaxID=1314806 RepID=A0ACB8Q7Y2_9AGAM|nr:hypothetical protein K488DRAFT_90571 [Vararia minispora EC-137]